MQYEIDGIYPAESFFQIDINSGLITLKASLKDDSLKSTQYTVSVELFFFPCGSGLRTTVICITYLVRSSRPSAIVNFVSFLNSTKLLHLLVAEEEDKSFIILLNTDKYSTSIKSRRLLAREEHLLSCCRVVIEHPNWSVHKLVLLLYPIS